MKKIKTEKIMKRSQNLNVPFQGGLASYYSRGCEQLSSVKKIDKLIRINSPILRFSEPVQQKGDLKLFS